MENMGKNLESALNRNNYQQKYAQLIKNALQDEDVQIFLRKNSDKIDKSNIDRSYAKIYEFVEEKKKIKEGKPSFAKGYEPHLTINNKNVDVVYSPSEEQISLQEKKIINSKFQLIDIPSDVKNAVFDDYLERNIAGRRVAIDESYKFLEMISNKDVFTPGLYLSGDFGVGKTYLMGAIANELALQKIQTIMVHFPTFAVSARRLMIDGTLDEKLNLMKKVPVLMFDDIGAESMTDWIRDELLAIILQYRMEEKLPTFFSSNFTMNDLEEHLSETKTAKSNVKAKRIMERIRYLSKEVIVTGENQRQKN